MIKKLTLLMAASALFAGVAVAEEAGHGHHGTVTRSNDHHDHHHHHPTCTDDEWTWSSVWCPGSSWTSTKVRRVCCKTTSCPSVTGHNSTVTTGTVPATECQTITATLWDLVADTLIICNKYTTECAASFANKATITFSVKAQGEESANAAPGGNTNGMLVGAGLAMAGLVALFL